MGETARDEVRQRFCQGLQKGEWSEIGISLSEITHSHRSEEACSLAYQEI